MKVDLKKELASYSAPRGSFAVVTVPPLRYLMINGRGDPNTSPTYATALQALYPVAYKLKFLSKAELGRDYTVMPLEGLWWADDMDAFTTTRDASRWQWTLLNLVPDWITAEHVERAKAAATRSVTAPVDTVRLELLDEGLSVQTLHLGPYDDETAVLDELHHRFIPDNGMRLSGRHHEIYLSDARRTAPERLRTILRQPVVAGR